MTACPFSHSQSFPPEGEDTMLQALLDTIVDSVLVIDQGGIIQSANTAALRMFGYSTQELIGQNVNVLMPEPYRSEHDSYLRSYHETGEAKIMGVPERELTARRKNGDTFPIELGVSAMQARKQPFYVGIVREISKRKKAEQERDSLIEALHASNSELDAFANVVSHDLREPLRGLGAHAQFLREDFGDLLGESGVSRLERMLYLCKRSEKLIEELHSFSRLGYAQLICRPADLNLEIAEIKVLMADFLEANQGRIVVPKPLPRYSCDIARVRKALENLILNAVNYNQSSEKMVEVGFLPAKDHLKDVFYVKDNGIGIEEHQKSEVFKMFKRLRPDDESVPGTGSGLAFVKRIVGLHKGRIWVESTPGFGSTFYFTLLSI